MTGPEPPQPEEMLGRRPPPPGLVAALARAQAGRGGTPRQAPTPGHIVVAGHDFRVGPEAFPEDRFDFSAMALRRAKHLLAATPGPSAIVMVLDAPSGQTAVFTRQGTTLPPPITEQSYGRLSDGERYESGPVVGEDTNDPVVPSPPRTRRLKDDQFDLLSVLDVLDLVYWCDVTANIRLGELSFFTHANYEGPQLFNSRNRPGHSMGGPYLYWPGTYDPTPHWKRLRNAIPPHAGPPAKTKPPPTQPATRPSLTPGTLYIPTLTTPTPSAPPPDWEQTYRDPCDRDGRAVYDFGPHYMPAEEVPYFVDAFGPEGCVRYWGGCVSTLDFDLLLSTRLAKGYRIRGLGPNDVLTITPRLVSTGRWAQLRLREEGVAVADPRHFEVPFEAWRMLLLRRQWGSYPALTARSFRVPTYAPVPGLWAYPEPGPDGWMHVPPSLLTTGITDLVDEYLYEKTDPEGRGYVVHRRPL